MLSLLRPRISTTVAESAAIEVRVNRGGVVTCLKRGSARILEYGHGNFAAEFLDGDYRVEFTREQVSILDGLTIVTVEGQP